MDEIGICHDKMVNRYYKGKYALNVNSFKLPEKGYYSVRKAPVLPKNYIPPSKALLSRLCKAYEIVIARDNLAIGLEIGQDIDFSNVTNAMQKLIENFVYEQKQMTIWRIGEEHILIPEDVTFMYTSNVFAKESARTVKMACAEKVKLLLMDPPWANNSIRRGKQYQTMKTVSELGKINDLVHTILANDAFVMVWVTNKPSYKSYLLKELFPKWNCEYVTTWYWVKVANNLDLVTPMESIHRLPYEQLVIGYRGKIEDVYVPSRVFVSIPLRHSWKPPLEDIFVQMMQLVGEKVELFARELKPGWLSIGNEVRRNEAHVVADNCRS